MDTMTFKIRGMDCAEEVATLKRALGPVVGGEERLSFDLINGKIAIERRDDGPSEEAVREAVAKTGMRAVPWEEYVAQRDARDGQPLWTTHGRAILCGVSGLALLAGAIAHGFLRGWLEAIAGPEEGAAYPLVVVVCYVAAMASGVWFVLPKALYAARTLRPDMNLLMTVAIVGAVILGEWMEAATVAFLFALALLLETWSVGRARKAIRGLVDLSPTLARCRCPHDGDIEEKPVEDVALGTVVIVRPGDKIPLDGTLVKGSTTVNQAPITGESIPVEKGVGDDVFAGSINIGGAFEFEVTRAAGDTTLARIIRLVEEAQSRRAPSEQWVERFARYYTPAMMFLALGVALLPPLVLGDWSHWFYQALVILVIACPCALVISTPVSIVAGLASAARAGVLIKGGVFLEAPATIRAIAFDKTGTMTTGRPEVQRILPLNGHTDHELLERAAAMEMHSDHPLAGAILRRAREEGIVPAPAESFQLLEGMGAEADYNGQRFWIGSHRLLHDKGQETPECHEQAEALEDAGHSVVAIGNQDHVCGLISVADSLREDSAETVEALKKIGIEHIALITGDNMGTARAVAASINVDEVQAELLPEEKVAVIERLVKEYGRVAMVGDGINDAPALAAATVGIAMGAAGSDAAIETADIALMSDDLTKIPWLIGHSRRTLRIIKQNIGFALGLKFVFIVMAFAGVATLWMAIAADMGASLLVIFNGLRLLRA
ncbi:MAG: heavy metal translocating P-type ATPase [Candidatus Hydrogenedentes bacterium]|nr:heavy metal translocating P-type ATPase [Candidatus Hydrogenedentota bacterium]